MNYNVPDHFSYHFELSLNKIPAKQSDRIALNLLLPSLIAALFLIALGIFELLLGARPNDDQNIIPFWFSFTAFDIVLILLGLWIILRILRTYFQYKKVFYDGKKITMIYRSPFGAKTTVKESIKNYEGVRFRVEFFQFGIINKNKYIIELYHEDFNKIAPLYIATSGRNIRTIWANYAQYFKLPQIFQTDTGMAVREFKDIGKSIAILHKEGLLKDDFNAKEKIPSSIIYHNKDDKIVIKSRKLRWDIYNTFLCIAIGTCALFLGLGLPFIKGSPFTMSVAGALFFLIILNFLKLFTKDKLIIKPDKLIVIHKTFAFSRKKYELKKEDIEAVDVAYSPVSERHFLAVIGGDKTLVFGKKLPISDLDWIRKFLIHHTIKK